MTQFHSRFFGLFWIALVYSAPSHAIVGTLLPAGELPDYVCLLRAERLYENATKFTANDAYCSAVLVTPSTLLSAAHCHPDQIRKMGSMRLEGRITAECGKGKVIRVMEASDGLANPMFSVEARMELSQADRTFDVSVWKLKAPVTEIAPIPVSFTESRVLEILRHDYKACRSFGFGTTNDGSYGVLNGAVTPVTAMSSRVIISDLVPGDNGERVQGGSTAPGDSGGALVCETPENGHELIGIISRGKSDFAPHSAYTADLSLYSLPSFNRDWIERAESGRAEPKAYMRSECEKMSHEAQSMIEKNARAIDATRELKKFRAALADQQKRLRPGASLSVSDLLEIYDRLYLLFKEAVQKGQEASR